MYGQSLVNITNNRTVYCHGKDISIINVALVFVAMGLGTFSYIMPIQQLCTKGFFAVACIPGVKMYRY